MKTILLIGGARSGKSHFAQEMALKSGKRVLFVATAVPGDDEMQRRIEEHQRARPKDWNTLEITTHIGREIIQRIGEAEVVIVDCITLLVSNILGQYTDPAGEIIDESLLEKEVTGEIDGLVECINHTEASFIIVTNEVGEGLVPANKMSRLYRDLLGRANQLLVQRADEVYLMVAGLPVMVKPTGCSGINFP